MSWRSRKGGKREEEGVVGGPCNGDDDEEGPCWSSAAHRAAWI